MELLHTDGSIASRLAEYLSLLAEGVASREAHDQYADALSAATAIEVNAALHGVLSRARDVEALKAPVARFIRAVSVALDAKALPEYPEGSLFARLDAENGAIARELERAQACAVSLRARKFDAGAAGLASLIGGMGGIKGHYVALQNELFPLFESASGESACVKLMWAIEDDVLAVQRRIASDGPAMGERDFWKAIGEFYLGAGALAYRERRILFPVAFRAIASAGEDAEAGSRRAAQDRAEPGSPHDAGAALAAFASRTGSLARGELEAIFRVLPIDVAFIGSDDRVKFYSNPPHRIFPRSPAVIGRLVQNCHPPKSVATVERILESFKSGSRETAEFWLNAGDRFVHIEYLAVRDPAGRYLGTLEVSQDATRLRSLEGERRLLAD